MRHATHGYQNFPARPQLRLGSGSFEGKQCAARPSEGQRPLDKPIQWGDCARGYYVELAERPANLRRLGAPTYDPNLSVQFERVDDLGQKRDPAL